MKPLHIALLAGAGLGLASAAWYYGAGTNPADELADLLVSLTTTEQDRVAQLHPDAQSALAALIARLQGRGIKVRIGQTFRTPAGEKAAIDSDLSAIAETGHSWHEIRRGVDLYPFDPETGKPDMAGRNTELFRAMHEEAAAVGWRGIAFHADGSRRYITTKSGKQLWDGGHLEWRAPYSSMSEAWAAEGVTA